jgi:hypothetical protein
MLTINFNIKCNDSTIDNLYLYIRLNNTPFINSDLKPQTIINRYGKPIKLTEISKKLHKNLKNNRYGMFLNSMLDKSYGDANSNIIVDSIDFLYKNGSPVNKNSFEIYSELTTKDFPIGSIDMLKLGYIDNEHLEEFKNYRQNFNKYFSEVYGAISLGKIIADNLGADKSTLYITYPTVSQPLFDYMIQLNKDGEQIKVSAKTKPSPSYSSSTGALNDIIKLLNDESIVQSLKQSYSEKDIKFTKKFFEYIINNNITQIYRFFADIIIKYKLNGNYNLSKDTNKYGKDYGELVGYLLGTILHDNDNEIKLDLKTIDYNEIQSDLKNIIKLSQYLINAINKSVVIDIFNELFYKQYGLFIQLDYKSNKFETSLRRREKLLFNYTVQIATIDTTNGSVVKKARYKFLIDNTVNKQTGEIKGKKPKICLIDTNRVAGNIEKL